MSLNYKELREKVIKQMRTQVEDVKTVTVEQWAKDNGFSDVYFDSYEEAKEWVENNVNSKKNRKKDFYEYEKNVDKELQELADDLENGSSSAFTQKARELSKNVVKPAIRTLGTAAAINFAAAQAVGIGLTKAGAAAHSMATEAINGIGISSKIDFGLIKGPIESAEGVVKEGLTNTVDDAQKTFNNKVVPIAKKATSAVLGFFQAKGIIKNAKNNAEKNKLKAENEKQSDEISELKAKIEDMSEGKTDSEVAKRRGIALKNVGKIQQMKYIVSQMQDLFKEEGISIPDVPENCTSMEDYGKLLRKSMKNQNVSGDKTDMVYTSMDIYKDNIKKMTKELKLGKTNVVKGTMDNIKDGVDSLKRSTNELGTRATYSIKRIARNAVEKGTSKEDVDKARKYENKVRDMDVEPSLA